MKSVDGVSQDYEIDTLLMEFGENRFIFTIGWWISSYGYILDVRNRANQAIVQAHKKAGVVMPSHREQVELS
jgi:small-conductance mechanosensitive channel